MQYINKCVFENKSNHKRIMLVLRWCH